MQTQSHRGRRRWGLAAAGIVLAGLASSPAFAAPPGGAAARGASPVFGAANVPPTQPVEFEHVRGLPPSSSRGVRAPDLVVAVTNGQGTTLYAAPSPTVAVDRAAGRVTWTPPAVRADGVVTSVLGRYTEDAVALVRGHLPGLTAAQRQALRQQGSVSLPGASLAAALFPAAGGGADGQGRDARPALVRGEVAGVQGDVLRLFDGPALTLPGARVRWPGHPQATLADLRPGLIVQVHEPPALRPAAADRGGDRGSAPAALVQVLPTPGVVTTVFTTGSAVGEPVRWRAAAASTRPSVLVGDPVSVTAQDSYGNPATTGSFQAVGQASPQLDASFSAPAGTIQQGEGQTTVTDHKAQAVSLTLQTQGPFSQDDQSIAMGTVQFQPGPPTAMTIQAASPVTAGTSEIVEGAVTDVYGNAVLPSALDFYASAGAIQTPVTTQAGTGAYRTEYTAPERLTSAPGMGEAVTLAGRSEEGSAAAQASVTVNPGPVARLVLQAPTLVLAGQSVPVSGTAQDVYGNAVLNGTAVDFTASAGSVPGSVQTQGGQFQATFQAPSQPGSVTVTAAANGVFQTATIQVAAPAPSGSTVQVRLGSGANGAVTISGDVTGPGGGPVAGAPVTLTVVGASPGAITVTTNGQGQFSIQVTPTASQGAVTVTASVPTQGGGQALGQGWIDPTVYGNQPWTDTGLTVQAGQLVCVQATGSWAGQLYASVGGSQGTPVLVGANGCFVSGTAGALFLGTNGAVQPGTVDANIAIATASNLVPTLDLTTSASSVAPGGQATISGQLMAGSYPVVGATVSLSATAGSLSASQATTDGQGQFQATWTAPQSGSTTITASFQPPVGNAVQQSIQESTTAPTLDVLAMVYGGSAGATGGNAAWTAPSAAFDDNVGTVAATPHVYGFVPTQFTLTRTLANPTSLAQIVVAGIVSNWDNAANTQTDGFTVNGLVNGQWVTLAPYEPLAPQLMSNGQYVYTRVITLSQPVTISALRIVWPNAETSFLVNEVWGYATPIPDPVTSSLLEQFATSQPLY
ncbi:MAG: hypothetical protein K6U87_11160 [Firmicutes bacterium]|nr:hypothetical protein [Bacillota bacterium]